MLESTTELQPPSWFLTPQEITAARNGCSLALRPYSLQGNSVELLVNGDEVFKALYDDLSKTQSGDFIWMTGWDIDGAVMLLPDPSHPEKAVESRIDIVLLNAINRSVDIRMLLNFNALSPLSTGYRSLFEFLAAINLAAVATTGKIMCGPDDRHNDPFGSLHQKCWVINRQGETVAYVGSMDISDGRYDTKKHDQDLSWKSEPTYSQGFYGFTGGMLRIKGPAVIDIARHLYDQVNDPVPNFPYFQLAPLPAWSNDPPIHKYDSSAQVQVLLTAGPLGADQGYYSNWAPKGETTILHATIKAISLATKYIYLSDQFMWYPPIMEAIANRLPYVDAVLLVTDSGYAMDYLVRGHDFNSIRDTKFYYQFKAWECLKDQVKVTAYHLVKETYDAPPPRENNQYIIYTHWKVLIVDDEFAIIGSAGAERSGMTNDIDMSVGIYDAKTVTGIRKQLWSEHLNLNFDDHCLDDPLVAIKTVWPREAASCGRVRKYWPQDVPFWDYYRDIFEMFEPCGFDVQSKWCQ
jgi:phospholipase D1/2